MIQYPKGQENPISRNPFKYNFYKLYEPLSVYLTRDAKFFPRRQQHKMSVGSIVEFNDSFCKPNFKETDSRPENLAPFNFFPCYLFSALCSLSGQPADV